MATPVSEVTKRRHGNLAADENNIISCVGTLFEWYDYIVFGSPAPVIAKHVFPVRIPL